MGHGFTLRTKVALAGRLLRNRAALAAASAEVDLLLPEVLFRTHCVARASVPLMAAALARADALGSADRVAHGMCEYLRRHIEEEREHGAWVLEDLGALGVAADAVLARTPPPTIAQLVGAQYYWIEHAHPVALLSYIAVLEEYVTPADVMRELAARSRLPRPAFRTLLEHSDVDPSHVAELYALIDALPLSSAQAELLGVNAFRTIELLNRSFDELGGAPAVGG